MNAERPIHLDLFSSRLDTGLSDRSDRARPNRRHEPDADARERFENALVGGSERSNTPASAPPTPAPFSLFGALSVARNANEDATLSERLTDAIDQLAVSEDGGNQVRMVLKDDLLPGVVVTVQEAHGRLEVAFTCSVETSRQTLVAAMPEQAPLLANRLRRDVLLRVESDDGDPVRAQEALAQARG